MLSKIYYPELIADNYVIEMITNRDEYVKMLFNDDLPVTDADENGCAVLVNFTDDFAESIHGPLVCSCETSQKLAAVIRSECITEDDWGLHFDRVRCIDLLKAMANMQIAKENEENK